MVRISTNQYHQSALNALLDQQSRVSRVQEQIATGRRILSPSDDPSGAARVLELAQGIESIQRYNRNIGLAESRLNIEESVLEEVGNTLTRVRELAVKAKSDSNTPADRRSIATEVRSRLDHLVELANSTDGNGEYLFAGARTDTRPFATTDGTVGYQGDQNERRVQVGPGRTIATNHSGYDVFMDIGASYGATADTGNSSDAALAVYRSASTTDSVDGYTVSFATGPDGLEYTVTDAGGGTVQSGAFTQGEPIELADEGVTLAPSGEVQAGDRFDIAATPPGRRSMFAIVDRFADALESAGAGDASGNAFQAAGDRALSELDSAMEEVLQVRAQVGGRLNGLESERDANEAAALELKSTRSDIRDLDYASAISELSRRMAGMQAAQKSYAKIQGMSLFNYL